MISVRIPATVTTNGILGYDIVVILSETFRPIETLDIFLWEIELIQWIVHRNPLARVLRSADLDLGQAENDWHTILVSARGGRQLAWQKGIKIWNAETIEYCLCAKLRCYVCSKQEQSLLEILVSNQVTTTSN